MSKKLRLILALLFGFSLFLNAQTSEKEGAARAWINENATKLNINSDKDLSLRFVRKSISGETLRFQQMIQGVPVFDTEVLIHFDLNGDVSFSSVNNIDKTVFNIDVTPTISSQEAISVSNRELNSDGETLFQEATLFVDRKLTPAKLVYKIATVCSDKPGDWEAFVDAKTAALISFKDVSINHHKEEGNSKKVDAIKKQTLQAVVEQKDAMAPNVFTTGTGMVFLSDPLSAAHVAYGGNYTDNGDATNVQLDAARASVTLPEIDLTAGVYKLKSSYVDIEDFEAPNLGLFTQATSAFNFTRDNDAFEAVNSFYHLDMSLRYINVTLGITCKPQSNGGVLRYDPSGFNGADNSHFIPSTDRIAFGEGCVDDAEDADVIWHEFGHGVHDWMTGGSASSSQGLGEGSGDYWAQSYSRSLNQWTSGDAANNFMFSWDGHNECWGGRSTNYAPVYPGGLVGSIHTDGQIWATSLMKIYDVLGRTKTDKAFLEGLALTNSSSNQQTAAIAVRQAAINMNYSCADIKVITEKFTQTGYVLPAIALKINCPGTQTVNADVSGTYTVPSFASLSNAINGNCNAVITQSPAVGAVVPQGTHVVTMTATSGSSVNCTFNLVVQAPLGVDEVVKNRAVVIYPNPATNTLNIKGEFDTTEKVSIFNMLGQNVMNHVINASETAIDISKLSNGVYIMNFELSKTPYKFVKQ